MKYIYLILILLLFNINTEAFSLRAWNDNRKAESLLNEKRYEEAQELLTEALAHDPFRSELHLNLGLAFEGQGKISAAQSSYDAAVRHSQDQTIHFLSYFNVAQLLGKQKKVDEALEFYQKALQANPLSIEAKTNIELLLQSQSGGGKGQDNQDKQDQQNEDKKDEQQQPDQPQKYDDNRKQPQKYKAQELSEGDVKKILEELKSQEQKIRAEFSKQQQKKEKSKNGKDW